jgi:hypothetical protein
MLLDAQRRHICPVQRQTPIEMQSLELLHGGSMLRDAQRRHICPVQRQTPIEMQSPEMLHGESMLCDAQRRRRAASVPCRETDAECYRWRCSILLVKSDPDYL